MLKKIRVRLNSSSDQLPFLDELGTLICTVGHRRCSFPCVQMARLYCLKLDKRR